MIFFKKMLRIIHHLFNNNKYKMIELIDLSIDLEYGIGKIYYIFHKNFPDDSEFWLQISKEENGHASILKNAKDLLFVDKFPIELILKSKKEIKNTLTEIKKIINYININNITVEDAFNIALKLEDSAAEKHYELFMNIATDDKIKKLFQKLNDEDKNHYNRLLEYKKIKDLKNCEM